jgi:kinesin family member 4
LKDFIKAIADKMNLAEKLSADNDNLVSYQNTMKDNENKIHTLEKEKDELAQQLKFAQSKSKSDPSLDDRRFKIQELENQIAELRKKCNQQANLIRMKEKNDLKIASLNSEIQQIKAAKVRISLSVFGFFFK